MSTSGVTVISGGGSGGGPGVVVGQSYNQGQNQMSSQPLTAQASTKRDKRRMTLASKLDQITDMFENERDFHYSEMLRTLQSTLYSLHVGDNAEFLEELTDIEEIRDEQLVTLYLWEKYQLERTEQEYNQDVELANEEHRQMTDMVKEKLMAKLESQRRKLSEDKALLDIANDHSFFLSSSGLYHSERHSGNNINSGYGSSTGGGLLYVPGSPSGRDGNMNGNTLNGGGGGFSSQSGLERRALRRRGGAYDDYSGLSGGEGSGGGGGAGGGGGGGGGGGTSTGRRRGAYNGSLNGNSTNTNGPGSGYRTGNAGSDMEAFSDRDLEGMLFSKDREAPTTRHSSKAYHGVRVLKPDEAQEDIELLRAAIRRSKRP